MRCGCHDAVATDRHRAIGITQSPSAGPETWHSIHEDSMNSNQYCGIMTLAVGVLLAAGCASTARAPQAAGAGSGQPTPPAFAPGLSPALSPALTPVPASPSPSAATATTPPAVVPSPADQPALAAAPPQSSGAPASASAAAPGVVEISCNLHKKMRAAMTPQEHQKVMEAHMRSLTAEQRARQLETMRSCR